MTPVLQVRNLTVTYATDTGPLTAVDNVSFDLQPGERFGLVGESGSGKSTLAMALLRMIRPPGRIESGEIMLDGVDVLTLGEEDVRRLRLASIALVPQGAMSALNPVLRIRDQFRFAFRDHDELMSPFDRNHKVADLLSRVGLDPKVAGLYPHELSGGMKQRVSIALAISLQPRVIVADEPTSALDVIVQRHVMNTLEVAQATVGASAVLVGHDMGLMAQSVNRLGVMYAGALVEVGSVHDLFTDPLHPYTQLLIASLPSFTHKGEFHGIPGLPPSLRDKPTGCPFNPRCPRVMDVCHQIRPALRELRPNHLAACHLY